MYVKQTCRETDRYKAINKVYTSSNKELRLRAKECNTKYECFENGMCKWKKKISMVNNAEKLIDIKR